MLDRTKQPELSRIEELNVPIPTDTTFPNGIPVSVLSIGGQDIVRIDITFNAGKINQTKLLQSNFTCSTLREGTAKYDRSYIAERLDFYGSWIVVQSLTTYTEMTIISMNKYVRETLEIAFSEIVEPLFPEKEVDEFKRISKTQWEVNNEKVEVISNKVFHANFLGRNHVCGWHAEEDDYDKIDRADLQEFFRQHYHSNNCRVYLSGKVTDEVYNTVEQILGNTAWGDVKPATTVTPQTVTTIDSKRLFVEKAGATQSAIKIGKMLVGRTHPDYAKLRLLVNLFGGSFCSRLMNNIREEKGYTYGINASYMHVPDASYMLISTECDNKYVEPVIAEVYKELDNLCSEKISEEELTMAKNYYQGDMIRTYENPLVTMGAYISMDYNKVGRHHLVRCCTEANSATADELHELAQKYFGREGFLEVVAGLNS